MDDRKICRKLLNIYTSAKDRDIECSLSFATVKKLMKRKTCYFTGVTLTEEPGPNQRTIDRLDNSKGYIEGNVIACTMYINTRKDSLSLKQIVGLYKGIKHLL